MVEFTSRHIVRHPLIAKMLQHLDGPAQKHVEPKPNNGTAVPSLMRNRETPISI